MNNKQYIDATVEHLFEKTNDRNILKAFLYRVTLNWTPRDVGLTLGLSQNQVNNLNSARLYRLSEPEKYQSFVKSYSEARRLVGDHFVRRMFKKQINRLEGIKNRTKLKRDIVTAKLSL